MDEAKRNAWRVKPEIKLTATILANGGVTNSWEVTWSGIGATRRGPSNNFSKERSLT